MPRPFTTQLEVRRASQPNCDHTQPGTSSLLAPLPKQQLRFACKWGLSRSQTSYHTVLVVLKKHQVSESNARSASERLCLLLNSCIYSSSLLSHLTPALTGIATWGGLRCKRTDGATPDFNAITAGAVFLTIIEILYHFTFEDGAGILPFSSVRWRQQVKSCCSPGFVSSCQQWHLRQIRLLATVVATFSKATALMYAAIEYDYLPVFTPVHFRVATRAQR